MRLFKKNECMNAKNDRGQIITLSRGTIQNSKK